MIFAIEDCVLQIWTIHDVFKMHSKLSPHPLKETKRETFFHGLLSSPSLSSENELLEEVSSPILF